MRIHTYVMENKEPAYSCFTVYSEMSRRLNSTTLLTLSALRVTDGSFQPVPSVTIVLFVVTALP